MTTEELKKPLTNFKELPDPVRGWLASTQITYLISDLNRRLGFSEEEKMRVVPTLILRLAISNLDPENFVSELSKLLDISPSAAKTLAQEVEEKMLRPVEIVLRNELGIDIKLIHFTKEMPVSAEIPKPTVPEIPTMIATAEAAHPTTAAKPEEIRPVPPPIYRPQPMPPQAAGATPASRPIPVMPRVEPLPVRPAPPPIPSRPIPQQSSASQATPVPFKIEPSRVPKIPENPNF